MHIISRNDVVKLKAGMALKISKLNNLEISKCSMGSPVNIADYIMYRHCLLYNDVAKDPIFADSDTNIRFYFKDNNKEQLLLEKTRREIRKAKQNFSRCIADSDLFDAVYIKYCVDTNKPVSTSMLKKDLDKEIELDKFSESDPAKFNKLCSYPDIKLVAKIELLISRGELNRIHHSQNIIDSDGNMIGANLNEAVAWFKDPNNTAESVVLLNKLINY